ncbi:chaperone protein htpG [Octadecabacter antarcticus 307]|uniref:Chaperone protein HtpG n=1 Tax=Octadecabacter antarcticus 307 TaxID=391626 RepID=M9R6L4_9RHOB|nr:molecular chaperone HtpG [Octadecabacter antarcticus]AGI67403.1 chaperone protein htpG [Octadecabacter antarcticus 307]
MTDTGVKETFSFQTEVGQLLDIVAGSLYSNREIFLRELVSNASDACDKLRYEALTNPSLADTVNQFSVSLEIDKKAKTLSVSDNGIGMNHDDLLETLGTIARSGTGAFLNSLKDGKKGDLGLIGQFGVGFYSAFMVSEGVEVLTRKAGEEKSWQWASDGKGEFTIEPGDRDACGTTVVLHLKKDAKEFLEEARVRHIIKTYSDHISFPVLLGEDTLNAASAIWTRAPKDVTEEQHTEFYHHTSHAFDKPWLTLHSRVEGSVSHTSLLYVPSTAPFDLYDAERKSHVKLYVNRVFISENTKGLVPAYLRFLRGVVDSEDLTLNVSREMLQSDPKLAKIKTALSKKVIWALKKEAGKAPQEYVDFWKNFGAILKEGLIEDPSLRDRLLEICRFSSTLNGELTSLSDYVGRCNEGQDAIYYMTGDDAKKISQSPHLEGFKTKGVEVLLLSDHVDEFWLQHITEFEGKTFKSVTRGATDLDKVSGNEEAEGDNDDAVSSALNDLLIAIKMELGGSVKDVRPSKRLTDSPVCLIADDGDMDVNMERLLKQHGQLTDGMPRVLELNPDHRVIKKMAERAKGSDAASDALLKDAAHLLLDQARIADGDAPADPAEFGRRLSAVMDSALSHT